MKTIDIFQSLRRDELESFKRNLDGVDLESLTEGKKNLLHSAIAYRRTAQAKELILRGVDVNWQDADGQTPLHYAATLNQKEIASLILERGGDLSISDKHGNKPLWCAVFNARGNYEIVKIFLEAGASATDKNKHGRSPLDFARQIEDQNLVALLSPSEISP